MTETERLIIAILKYSESAPTHSALSTVHMLAKELKEAYTKEHAHSNDDALVEAMYYNGQEK